MDNNVHFGDCVLINGFLTDQVDSPVGFMSSKAYTKDHVYTSNE